MSSNQETEKHCTVLIHYEKGSTPTPEELSKRLESKKDSDKIEALEELLLFMMNGENFSGLLMTIIRFVVTSNDHRLKKLLMLYWETVDKAKDNGELKEEMILVCNALRNDLSHANEYVRGSTLRLVCKIKYYRILEPLKDVVLRNLSHRHSYVRRNAVMAVYSIVKSFGAEVLPDAAEEIEQLLLVEGDLSTKRNAFLMLLHCEPDRAVQYLFSIQDQVASTGDLFQLCVLELVRKVSRTSPQHRGRLVRVVFSLAASTSTAVSFDCAATLVTLSSSPVAIHQATSIFVTLLTEQSDNNVKLIVLDKLQEVQRKHRQVMEGLVMDIFRALSCPSLDVRKKVMEICLGSLVSPQNIKDVVGLLKKEVIKTMGYEAQSTQGNAEYRCLLIKALHACTAQYPDQAQSVMMTLMDFLTEPDQSTALEVVMYIRELVAQYSDLRAPILQRLADNLGEMHQSRVLRGCLWLLSEYCEDSELCANVVSALVKAVKPLPLVAVEDSGSGSQKKDSAAAAEKTDAKDAKPAAQKFSTQTVIQADGTYGTKIVYESVDEDNVQIEKKVPLRNLITGGDQLLAGSLGLALTRLALKAPSLSPELKNETLFVVTNLYKILSTKVGGSGSRADGAIRLAQCIRALVLRSGVKLEGAQEAAAELVSGAWTSGNSRNQLMKVLELQSTSSDWALGSAVTDESDVKSVAPDDGCVFRQLRERKGTGFVDVIDEDDFGAARGSVVGQAAADGKLFLERLAKVTQMTGLADPVYVEAFLQVHSFDLVLELLLVNRTQETLQNVLVELTTQGDLKIVDRPVAMTLAPGQHATVHASIKVASTETGVVFGYVTYEKKSAEEKECTVMNEVHVDILDYIECATIGELAFHNMWSEFEWENKININSSIEDVGTYLGHIMRNTNMSIVGRSSKATSKGEKKKKT
jgi:coatomer subunit beta